MKKIKKNWYLFLNEEQEFHLTSLKNENKISFVTWVLFSIILPLAPFLISILINFLLIGFCDWGKILNNGSLPIISYGFITSGIVYIMEKIKNDNQVVFEIRERIMPIAVLLLFLNSSIFILETSVKETLNGFQHFVVFLSSTLIFYFSLKVSQNMFFLQRRIADSDYAKTLRDEGKSKHGKTWD